MSLAEAVAIRRGGRGCARPDRSGVGRGRRHGRRRHRPDGAGLGHTAAVRGARPLSVGTKTSGIGIGVTAYTLGMRHAFDADHISAIDNTTRKLIADASARCRWASGSPSGTPAWCSRCRCCWVWA